MVLTFLIMNFNYNLSFKYIYIYIYICIIYIYIKALKVENTILKKDNIRCRKILKHKKTKALQLIVYLKGCKIHCGLAKSRKLNRLNIHIIVSMPNYISRS